MIAHASTVESAADRAIRVAQLANKINAALSFWETWVIMAAVFWILVHFVPWARKGFPVVSQPDVFAFYAEERAAQ